MGICPPPGHCFGHELLLELLEDELLDDSTHMSPSQYFGGGQSQNAKQFVRLTPNKPPRAEQSAISSGGKPKTSQELLDDELLLLELLEDELLEDELLEDELLEDELLEDELLEDELLEDELLEDEPTPELPLLLWH